MSATNLTAAIAGIIYPVLNTSYTLSTKIDERSTVQITIYDSNASYVFQAYQPVTITDTLEGIKFTGFVNDASVTKYDANPALAWQLNCIDNHFIADKRTSNRIYTNQYSGVIAASMANDILGNDGVISNYAVRDDNTQIEFAQGTLNGLAATANQGGDLELASAGTSVFYNDPGRVSASTPIIRLQGTAAQGFNNNYTYRMIYSDNSTTVASGDTLFYDIWIESTCPEIKGGVDIVCTDGTAFRGVSGAGTDAEGIGPHPGNDLSGLANLNKWYTRIIGLGSGMTGKTIAYYSIAQEGDSQGLYTIFFRNISLQNYNGSAYVMKTHVFDSTQTTLQANAQLQNNGYYNVSVAVTTGYDNYINSAVGNDAIGNANIVQSSFMTWNASTPGGSSVAVQTSIDNGASWQTINNNSAIPNLLPGMVVSGRNIQYRISLLLGVDPTVFPLFTYFKLLVNSSYQSSKTDIIKTYTSQSDFNTGTYSNSQYVNGLTPLGMTRNYALLNYQDQPLYGSAGPSQGINFNRLALTTGTGADVRSRMDDASQWQNFIMEVDIQVSTNYALGLVYRTTNWGNSNDSYAYSVTVDLAHILWGKGNNSTGSGSFTQIQNVSITNGLTEGSTHRLKIIVNGNIHQIYLDGAQYINASDSSFTAAGYVGLRLYNNSGSTRTGYFSNFGILAAYTSYWTTPSISLAGIGNYGNSMIQWDTNQIPGSCTVTCQTSTDNGSTYQAVTNGGSFTGYSSGQSMSGKNLLIQMVLTCGDATAQPIINGVTGWVMGQYSSSGTRVAPALQLTPAQVAGSTVVNWTASTPTNTSITVATSTDGTNYTNVSNGGSIAGITTQPTATLDTFSTNSNQNYTNTFRTGGTTGTWFWDVINSRLSVSGGANALLLASAISTQDIDMVLDLDQSDQTGLVWRRTDNSNFYEIDVFDASSNAGSTNIIQLYKVVSNTKTQLGSNATISFSRGNAHRVRVTMIGTAITVYFDGVSAISLTDSALTSAGSAGLIEVSGIGRFYNLRVQPQGQNLNGANVYSKVTLSSNDPTVTPQLTDLTVAALHPNIGLGSLIPTADYVNTYVSANLDDLAKKSGNYYWLIDQNLNFIFSDHIAIPAPWILASYDQKLLLDGPVTNVISNALYRNRQTAINVQATGIFSETKIGDGKATSWALGYTVAALPTIRLNGVLQTVGQKSIDSGKQFYYEINNNTITQDSSGTVLQLTDTLSISYTGNYTTSVSVDNTSLNGTINQKQFARTTGRITAQSTLLTIPSQSFTASGVSGDLDVSRYSRTTLDVNVTALSGTSPTIQFFADRKGTDGNYYQLTQSSVLSASGTFSTSIGPFAPIAQSLGSAIRFRWTIGGTSPSITFSATMIGQMTISSGGLGIVEVVEDVSSQNLDITTATNYCTQLLQRYGTMGRTLTFKTIRTNPSLSVGQYLPVFIPEMGIVDASMLITATDTTQDLTVDAGSGQPTQMYFQSVTATENANLASPWKLLASTVQ